jgi:hypothetical protein
VVIVTRIEQCLNKRGIKEQTLTAHEFSVYEEYFGDLKTKLNVINTA